MADLLPVLVECCAPLNERRSIMLKVPAGAPIAAVHQQLAAVTGIPPGSQRLRPKDGAAFLDPARTVCAARGGPWAAGGAWGGCCGALARGLGRRAGGRRRAGRARGSRWRMRILWKMLKDVRTGDRA